MEASFHSDGACRRVAETRQEGYDALTAEKLSATQQMVIDCFDEHRHLTREDIAAITNLKLSSVCGRVRELLDANRLIVDGKRQCPATSSSQQLLAIPAHG